MSLWLWIGLPLLFLLGLFLNAIRSGRSRTTRTTDPLAGARRRSCTLPVHGIFSPSAAPLCLH